MPSDINVLWLTYHPTQPAYLYHDQAFLHLVFTRKLWVPVNGYRYVYRENFHEVPEGTDGLVVVMPAMFNIGVDKVDSLNADLARFKWVVLILTSDESTYFDISLIKHPNMRLWQSNPKSSGPQPDLAFGEGYREEAPSIIRHYRKEALDRDLDYFFSGQDIHPRRNELNDALNASKMHGVRNFTSAFGSGYQYPEYLQLMARAKIIPCPSGSVTQDSFRFYEALEAGCVPIADDRARRQDINPDGYWENVFGKNVPFPIITDWHTIDEVAAPILADYPATNNKVFAWWQRYKRDFVYTLESHIREVSKMPAPVSSRVEDRLTVVIPTSPIPSHPSTDIFEQTMLSVRENVREAEVIVLIDGVRPEQEDRRKAYDLYVQRLLWLCDHYYNNAVPILFSDHNHQASMLRVALEYVKTPTVLFVEHDTPLTGQIPWEGLVDAVESGFTNMVRMHYDRGIHDDHQYLMLGDLLTDGDIPLKATRQWSQRPHLANTEWYRQILKDHIRPEAKTMIEDAMHGKVADAEWEQYKLTIYNPPFDMQRSKHLDGRGGDVKYDMQY